MEPTIRRAIEADSEQLALLSLVAWDEAYRDILDPDALRRRHDEPSAVRRERWVNRIAENEVFVALADIEIVGYARTTAPAPGESHELLGLYTRERYWRSGLGSRLLLQCLPSGAAHLWLFEGNERALRFYERHGFSLDGRRRLDPPYGAELHMSRGATW
ncbi:GNAT family N-acetyltransferase [Herbiconiux sp.]|uniref:GNAT family N-acetyltransferase n=1 Tax=Herbiconiux sp. TaxID=1871186 RepID=UPI0025BA6BDD|nr:GNAT family N-acetyltransferase [Herbiconiux sp.]